MMWARLVVLLTLASCTLDDQFTRKPPCHVIDVGDHDGNSYTLPCHERECWAEAIVFAHEHELDWIGEARAITTCEGTSERGCERREKRCF